MVVKAVIKGLLTGMALLALSASAATESFTLVLVTQAEHFETQLRTFESLRECTNAGAELLGDQDLYIGFGCMLTEEIEHYPKGESKHDPES